MRRLAELNPRPLSADAVKTIFREVMSACLGLEAAAARGLPRPRRTFSESASRKHFGSAPNFMPMAAIDDVFRAVEAGNADYGVVPVENSTEGAVGARSTCCSPIPLKVCGEVRLRIHRQQLMSRAEGIGAARLSIRTRSRWRNATSGSTATCRTSRAFPVASNAEAARMALEDPESCAIAGGPRRSSTDSNILAPNIEDDPTTPPAFWSSPITTPGLGSGPHLAGVLRAQPSGGPSTACSSHGAPRSTS